jgi:hypothetical protein
MPYLKDLKYPARMKKQILSLSLLLTLSGIALSDDNKTAAQIVDELLAQGKHTIIRETAPTASETAEQRASAAAIEHLNDATTRQLANIDAAREAAAIQKQARQTAQAQAGKQAAIDKAKEEYDANLLSLMQAETARQKAATRYLDRN